MPTFTLPALDYAYDALEPHIDAQTMEIHHSKHHQAYVDKANAAVEGTEWEGKTPKEILTNLDALPADKKAAIINNVGGLCNHHFFWVTIGPNCGGEPIADLSDAIDKTFGSFAAFQEVFAGAAAARFGSGWAWLVVNTDGKLEVISTANQDSPLSLGYERVIGLDVWEHAYYLNYQNRRPDYVEAFWHVVNWEAAENMYQQALEGQGCEVCG